MAKPVLIDELHLQFRVSAKCPDKPVVAARHALRRRQFQSRLRQAIERLMASYSPLGVVRFTISR